MPSHKSRFKQSYDIQPAFSPVDKLCDQLKTNLQSGLSSIAIENAQRNYGPNKLEGEGAVKWYSVLLRQLSNAMILVSFSQVRGYDVYSISVSTCLSPSSLMKFTSRSLF